jgi:hypothetical protein
MLARTKLEKFVEAVRMDIVGCVGVGDSNDDENDASRIVGWMCQLAYRLQISPRRLGGGGNQLRVQLLNPPSSGMRRDTLG